MGTNEFTDLKVEEATLRRKVSKTQIHSPKKREFFSSEAKKDGYPFTAFRVAFIKFLTAVRFFDNDKFFIAYWFALLKAW